MKAMITGHRPNKLGGYQPNPLRTKVQNWLSSLAVNAKTRDNDLEIITGMALGVDQWWAQAAIDANIPFHAYIPFEGQESVWPDESQRAYHQILSKASTKTVVASKPVSRWGRAMQLRNEAMVDDADWCIAVWNTEESGGTWNCMNYIAKQNKHLLIYIPSKDYAYWEKNGKYIKDFEIEKTNL